MAWVAPLTAVANASLSASQWNASVRDNLNETAPAKASASGQIFVATGINAITARTPSYAASSIGIETTSSTTYTTTLSATSGPSIAVTTGTKALVSVTALCQSGVANVAAQASYAISGATTLAADDQWAIIHAAGTASGVGRYSVVSFQQALTAGSNTFTMAYRSGAASSSGFNTRQIFVLPLS